jgi:predicted negative regulator of RcsB-dependent stress response
MMYSALRDRGGMIRAFYILTSSTSQEDFESQAVNQYRRFMEVRNNRAETEARRREAQQRSLTRRSQDRENGIIVGAKMRLNPNGEPCARRHLRIALDGQEDNKLATIIKVLVVSIDVKFDDYDKVVRFRKDSPHYTLV